VDDPIHENDPREEGPATDRGSTANPSDGTARIRSAVVEALKTCYDPEIPVDIYELGLIYDISVDDAGRVEIRMTLTSPACPVAGSLPGEVEQKARGAEGVTEARVELVWDPPWTPERMSEAARVELGFF
jgi:FeS assembly SUF system protein